MVSSSNELQFIRLLNLFIFHALREFFSFAAGWFVGVNGTNIFKRCTKVSKNVFFVTTLSFTAALKTPTTF